MARPSDKETWTLVLSRAAAEDPALRGFEQELLDQLQAAGRLGRRTVVTADLYHVPRDAKAWGTIRQASGPLAVLAWRYPRATFWLLDSAGVRGVRADVGGAAGEGRAIHCIDLRGRCCPGRVVEQVAAILPAGAAGGEVLSYDGRPAPRWYPVLDRSRCTGCLQCPEFCLFGVYEVADGRPVVAEPGHCKPGCPACARVCPAGAIMFPDYAAGGPIAGADTGTIEPFRLEDVDPSLLPPDCADALRKKLPPPAAPAAGAPCACSQSDACACNPADPAGCDCACDCGLQRQLDSALEQLEADEL